MGTRRIVKRGVRRGYTEWPSDPVKGGIKRQYNQADRNIQDFDQAAKRQRKYERSPSYTIADLAASLYNRVTGADIPMDLGTDKPAKKVTKRRWNASINSRYDASPFGSESRSGAELGAGRPTREYSYKGYSRPFIGQTPWTTSTGDVQRTYSRYTRAGYNSLPYPTVKKRPLASGKIRNKPFNRRFRKPRKGQQYSWVMGTKPGYNINF